MTAHVNKADLSPSWYIVQARPQAVIRAGEEILSLGVPVYIPQKRKEYLHNRQRRWISKYYPLMEAYFFIMATEHWARVLACESVVRILRNSGDLGSPIPITDAAVADIRQAQEAGEFDELRVNSNTIRPGDKVKVAEGAFAGIKGTVEAAGDQQLTILLTMLGREVRAKAPIEILRGKE